MEPRQARTFLLEQHDRLRTSLAMTQQYAERALAGEAVSEELHQHLAELRHLFADHNASEEALLGPILRLDPAWGQARIDRMFEEHNGEHAAIRETLVGPDLEVAARLPDLVEEIAAHMDAEERTFLSPGVLRNDAINLDDGD